MRGIYKDYSTATQKYLSSVEKYLKEKYGKVNDEWEQPLMMLATNVEMFNKCTEIIKRDGLIVIAKNGSPSKNAAILIQLEAQKQINKLLDAFGLTPKAQSKINLLNEDDDESLKELLGN